MSPKDHERLGRTVAHALRHAPEAYGLELDSAGWADLEVLLAALRDRRSSGRDLTGEHLEDA